MHAKTLHAGLCKIKHLDLQLFVTLQTVGSQLFATYKFYFDNLFSFHYFHYCNVNYCVAIIFINRTDNLQNNNF